jgi:iron complex outermembrane receptor protein
MLLCGAFSAFAQEHAVSGKVTSSDDGSGLPGVNILEKGTGNGTVSDSDGNFKITVGSNATLVFSFVGYASQEVAVGQQTTINVSLKSEITSLNEVVVIGYGEVKKKDATGSVISVKAEDFQKGVIASPEQLIQGKAAGVQITSASGEPGAGVNIRIRGTSSMQQGNNPLFVVDGIPLTGDDTTPTAGDVGRGGGAGAKNPLNFINPSDIESIDILKDASATAIYGSRGANGVVIIKTKSGKGMKKQFEYAGSVSVSTVAKKFNLLDRTGFLNGVAHFGGNAGSVAAGGVDYGASTDWQNEIARTAISNRHQLSYSDAINKHGNFRASFSYDNQQGVIRHSSMERLTGRLNGNYGFLDDKLKLGVQMTFSRVNDEAAPISNTAGFEGDLMGATYMANPTWNSYADAQFSSSNANPNAMLKYYADNTKTDRHLINVSLGYDIMPGLNFKINTGFDGNASTRGNAFSKLIYLSNGVTGNGRGHIQDNNTNSKLMEAFFTYDKEIGGGALNVVGGYSYQQFNTTGININGWGFSSPDMGPMLTDLRTSSNIIQASLAGKSYQQYGLDGSGASPLFFYNQLFPTIVQGQPAATTLVTPVKSVTGDAYNYTDELQSFFARANYTYANKYILTGTVRVDGSTKFGTNNKYGTFPSAAFAWKLSEEEFIPEFFDELKLRIGYGVTGNQNIPHNLSEERVRYGGISIQNGGAVQSPGTGDVATQNKSLKWEQTSQASIGLDFAIFKTKLKGTVDFYQKETTNMLIQAFAAQPSPSPFIYKNLPASVFNRGVELTLTYYAIDNEKAGLNFSVNGAINDNMVKNLGSLTFQTGVINGQGLSGAFAQEIANNQPLYAFYLREFLGYNAAGNTIYNGDYQKFIGKSPLPRANLGFTINARYKSWDISAFFNGQFGQYIYNNTANALFTAGSLKNGRNVTSNVVYSGESPVNAPDVSTRFLEKGDYLRFQNLNIGHNFKLEGGAIKNLRIGFSGQNLFVITNYSGRDPEVNINHPINSVPSAGIDYTAYPRARTYTVSINATF